MIMNALNGVWSDIYIRQITIQEELQKLAKLFLKELILNCITISVIGYEKKEKYLIYVSKKML